MRIFRVVTGENSRADYYASGLFVHHPDGHHQDLATGAGSALPSGESSIFPFVAVSCGDGGGIVVTGHDWGGGSSAFAIGSVPLTGGDYCWRRAPRLRGPLVTRAWAIGGGVLAADVAGGLHVLAPDGSGWSAVYVDRNRRGGLAFATDGGERLWVVGRGGLIVASADRGRSWRRIDRSRAGDDLTCIVWADGELVAAGARGKIARIAAPP
jgi:hypothetical protein